MSVQLHDLNYVQIFGKSCGGKHNIPFSLFWETWFCHSENSKHDAGTQDVPKVWKTSVNVEEGVCQGVGELGLFNIHHSDWMSMFLHSSRFTSLNLKPTENLWATLGDKVTAISKPTEV